ncbi:zinc finger protein 836 [Orussus abietinus]|uniref:zinc finger protein 836 n=1 Tax=Orussus abietinus TaxID=222816 RepID=UPI000C715FB2|nr:zinc finger protein 836 [Orussus abietinus]
MESYEDDDDTHFCIKCHLTISGLENYVRHRQSGCRPPEDKSEVVHDPPSTPTTVSYPEILNADAFFNSLELQSSTKTNARRSGALSERGKRSGRLESRKKSRKVHGDQEDMSGKEKLSNMMPVVTDLDDPTDHLVIPSLVGFPDIVTSTGKPSSSTVTKSQMHATMKMESTSYHGKSEGLQEASLESLMTKPERKRHEESQRMEQEQVWLEDTILADLVTENKDMAHSSLGRYSEFEYHQEEDSDEESLDEDLVDDSYSDTDEEHPPRGHTGGKWKPGLGNITQEVMAQMGDDDGDADDDHHEHPPLSHTGGKWKPTDAQTQKAEEYEAQELPGQPPPGHTRGKWVPGARIDAGTGYWCAPCGRKLASKLIYNRHLLSDLHARRSIQEIDGSLHLPRDLGSFLQRKSSRHQKALASRIFQTSKAEPREETSKRTRKREKEIVWCEMCHARVRRQQMGKHLLSHYHCRVAGSTPCSPKSKRFLLENMANVVRQCPFQCAPCRFYCNTEDTFLLHWRSQFHADTVDKIRGSYRCTPCDFWCASNADMEVHLESQGHRDLAFMMNGSVPVVIRREQALVCQTCGRRFRYNLQLYLHTKETGHESVTGSDEYQQRIACPLCGQVVRSLVSLQRHQLACHISPDHERNVNETDPPAPYFCSFCSLNFSTARDAVLHRRTSRHKEIRSRKFQKGSLQFRECPHCGEKHSDLASYKEHLLQTHTELCHRCPRCGLLFALSQDVTRHTKENECAEKDHLPQDLSSGLEDTWRCTTCPFATNSHSELIFHEALHTGYVEVGKDESSDKISKKYRCPLCEKEFPKVSLRNHIRSHTGERPFPCSKCYASFSRRSGLNAHEKDCVGIPPGSSQEAFRRRDYVCSECNHAFYTKHALRQHMLRHAGKKYKCGLPGCPTVLRTASELRSHRLLVHETATTGRKYRCASCPYAAKTSTQLRRHRRKHEDSEDLQATPQRICPYPNCEFRTKLGSHLRRHLRCHTGNKPYRCRHCSYASNNLENLRKHVLSTNLHPGKSIYECSSCISSERTPFCTNFAKELRAHLLEAHPQEFPTPGHAARHVSRIFDVDEADPGSS